MKSREISPLSVAFFSIVLNARLRKRACCSPFGKENSGDCYIGFREAHWSLKWRERSFKCIFSFSKTYYPEDNTISVMVGKSCSGLGFWSFTRRSYIWAMRWVRRRGGLWINVDNLKLTCAEISSRGRFACRLRRKAAAEAVYHTRILGLSTTTP